MKNLLQNFATKKVIVVGDVMIDSYMVGNVNRVSPEAPVPIVSIDDKKYRLGGAANVALNTAAFGSKVFLCSVIGNDEKSKIFKDLLVRNNLPSDGIIYDNSRKTTVKTRIISNGQHLLRIDDEDDSQISENLSEQLFKRIEKIIQEENIDILIFEDYDKGVLSPKLIQRIIKLCKEKGIRTSVDPKKRNFNSYSGVSLFKPNLKEFCDGCNIEKCKDVEILKVHTHEFLVKNDFNILMVTLSENGIFICNKENFIHVPAEIRDIVDVSGAGDTVISVASLLLSSTDDLKTIARISNIAGGIVCEKVGVVPINVQQLEAKIL